MNNIYKLFLIVFVLLTRLNVFAFEKIDSNKDSLEHHPNHILSLNVLHLAFQNFDWEYHYLPSKNRLGIYFKNSIAFNYNKNEAYTRQKYRLALGLPYTFSRKDNYRLYFNPCIEMINFFYNARTLDSMPYIANYLGGLSKVEYSVYYKDITKSGFASCVNFNIGGNYFLKNKLILGSYFGMGYRYNFTPDIVPTSSLEIWSITNEVISYFYLRLGFQVGFGL
jgi:hypothetical protein